MLLNNNYSSDSLWRNIRMYSVCTYVTRPHKLAMLVLNYALCGPAIKAGNQGCNKWVYRLNRMSITTTTIFNFQCFVSNSDANSTEFHDQGRVHLACEKTTALSFVPHANVICTMTLCPTITTAYRLLFYYRAFNTFIFQFSIACAFCCLLFSFSAVRRERWTIKVLIGIILKR